MAFLADFASPRLATLTRPAVPPSAEISKSNALEALVLARAYESSRITDALIAAAARSLGIVSVYTFDGRFARLGAPVATP